MRYQIAIKRVYDNALRQDGARFLTDRIWPRGIKKADLQLTDWLKSVYPSNALRKDWHAGKLNYATFCQKYRAEFCESQAALLSLMQAARQGQITLLTAVKDPDKSHVPVLKNALLEALANEDKQQNGGQASAVCYDGNTD
jgi:uncharacterized protein YeaO (DUF488 family)